MEKKLFRNEHDKVVAGVCSGLAEYMVVDVTIIRLLFVLSAVFLAGGGIIVYFVMWIVVPANNDINAKFSKFNEFYQKNQTPGGMYNSPNAFNNPNNSGQQTKWNTENAQQAPFGQPDFSKFEQKDNKGRMVGGAILLVLGIFFLMHSLGIMPFWFNIFKLYKLWPLILIAIGASLILKNKQKKDWERFNQANNQPKTEDTVVDATVVEEEKKDENPPMV